MRPQVFVATFVYCLPDLKGQNGFVQPVAVRDLSSPEKRAPFAAACGSQFQCPHYTQRLLRCDRQVGGTEYGIAHVGVELAVIAGRGRAILGSKCVAVWRQQRAPALGGLVTPGVSGGILSALQGVLLRIQTVLQVAASRALNGEPRRGSARARRLPSAEGENGQSAAQTTPRSRTCLGQRWLTAERIALEQNASGWTMWDYQGGFGVVTKKDGTTAEDDAVLRALGLRPH